MRITLFIIFCITAFLSATRAVSGDSNAEIVIREDKKVESSDSPFDKKEIPLSVTRKSASNAIPALVVFAISVVALLLLAMV